MIYADLITLDELRTAGPPLTAAQLGDAPGLIAAASAAIGRAYSRAAAARTVDEVVQVGSNRTVRLSARPVLAVAGVWTDMRPVVRVACTLAAARTSNVTLRDGAVTLASVSRGVAAPAARLDLATRPCVDDLCAAVDAVPGWQATAEEGQGDLATAELLPAQGGLSGQGRGAELRAFTRQLDDWSLDPVRGTLTTQECRPDGYRFPDRRWGVDGRYTAFRVVYTAGLDPVPADVKRATILCVLDAMQRTARPGAVVSERSEDYAYTLAAPGYTLPALAAEYLSPYRDRTIT